MSTAPPWAAPCPSVHSSSGGTAAHRRRRASAGSPAGAGSENGTWLAGGGHLKSWFDDNVHYVGFLGRAHLNRGYYLGERPAGSTMDGVASVQRLTARVPSTDLFIG